MDLNEKLREAFGRFGVRDLAGAARACEEVLAVAPGQPQALHLLGVTRLVQGRAREAISFIGRALDGGGRDPVMVENLGLAHLAAGEPARAEALFREALAAGPARSSLQMRLGLALEAQGRHAEALAALEAAARTDPADADVWLNLGNALARRGEDEDAAAAYRKALALRPHDPDPRLNLGALYRRAGRFEDAEAVLREATALEGGGAAAWVALGLVYAGQRRWDEAIACYRRALELEPGDAPALNSWAAASLACGREDEAAALLERAIAARPGDPDAYVNLGNLRAEQGRSEEAAALYERALKAQPGCLEAHLNLGLLLRRQGALEAAIACYRRALEAGGGADLLNELGNAWREAGDFERAAASYREAIARDPRHVHAHYNLAETLKIAGRLEEAAALDERVLELEPRHHAALGALVHLRQHMCRWDGIERLWERLRREALAAEGSGARVSPFALLSMPTTPAEQLSCARAWAAEELAWPVRWRARAGFDHRGRARGPRLRVGYLSAAFRRHALAHLVAELFELHDRARVEVFVYSCGPDDGSPIRERIRRACDRFADVRGESDVAIARRIFEDRIDLLVDLDGWTLGNRLRVLALRPAPVQASWLGYPGTTGAECVDYLIADAFVVPEGAEPFYSEAIVRLPGCYQVNDRRREADAVPARREEVGLPAAGFVFCCFNQAYKILPEMFSAWMRILAAVPDSVLWLAEANRWAAGHLREAAAAAGIAPSRLIFAPRRTLGQYLAQYRLADLALDTFPYGSHTIASDALWMGCPLVALAGETFASRVSGSVLRSAGLPELVTGSFADYERLVLELAGSPERLRELRRRLQDARAACALFDTPGFARGLEQAYESMYAARMQAGGPEIGE